VAAEAASADLEAEAAVVLEDSAEEVLAVAAQVDRGNRMNKHLWLQSALRFTPGSNAPRALLHDKNQQDVCKATHARYR